MKEIKDLPQLNWIDIYCPNGSYGKQAKFLSYDFRLLTMGAFYYVSVTSRDVSKDLGMAMDEKRAIELANKYFSELYQATHN